MNEKRVELKYRLQEALNLREKKSVDLVRDLKIPKSAVSQYLSGKSQKMDSDRLESICLYLDVSEPWMLGYDVPMERNLQVIEEKPVETANMLADIFMDAELMKMIEEYSTLTEPKKVQVRDFVHFLSGKN